MAYENRTFQSTTANTPPTGTDPMVDNTASGDVQAIKLINPTAGSVAPWIDQAARAQSLPVALSTEDTAALAAILAKLIAAPATEAKQDTTITALGALTETAPASDTASSGLNGRLQRIAQRLTSLITAIGTPFQAGGSIGNTTFASTQSGTWTVQPGNTANTTAWKVDGSAVTQPVNAVDGGVVTIGAKADSAATDDTGTWTEIALIKRLLGKATTVEGTALAAATRTATTNGSDITNDSCRGAVIFLNTTASSGTGGLQLRVYGKDPISGNYFSLNAAPTAVTGNGQSGYVVYPGASTAAGVVVQATQTVLPRTFRISVTHGDASSYTYSVAYSLIP